MIMRLATGLARYHFGHAQAASECLQIARAHLGAAPSVWHHPIVHQFAGLAGCAVWETLDDEGRAAIETSLAALRDLAAHAPMNFAHRVSLVEGARCHAQGDVPAALAHFDAAIEQAADAEWNNDLALAHELIAGCHPDPEAARAALVVARDGYAAWGASAKVDYLDGLLAER
jgi:hypothetical protein